MAGEGVTVFVTTHYMDEAEYCDRLGLIYRGELIALGTPLELKTRHMTEEIVEVLCEPPHEAIELIEELPGIRHAALFGRGLHVVVKEAAEAIPAIVEKLTSAGYRAVQPVKIIPSLEDVFVSLIEERDRQETVQREVER
jgi:ABC-2 type transport system ATP-binding protein